MEATVPLLSKDSSTILMDFTNLVLRNGGNSNGSGFVGTGMYNELNQWTQTLRKDRKALFNILLRALTQMLPLITKEVLFIRFCMALEWIQLAFKISMNEFIESVPYLVKSYNESFESYIMRIERIVQKLKGFITLVDMFQSIYNTYQYQLTSVYLPTQYFNELKKGEIDRLPYAISAILDDPYPRSVNEWKERIQTAQTLFAGMNEDEHPFLWELEIPNIDFILRRNKSPSVASSVPFMSQLLSEEAMMAMVKKWDAREKFFIRIGTLLRNVNDEEPLTILDTMFAAFFHGLMQYFATKGQITPMIDDKYKTLYRGLRPITSGDIIDVLFPIDELGNRRSYKEKGIIATSFTRSVAEDYYTQPIMMSSTQIKRGLVMMIDIEGSKGPILIAPITHTTEQDEVLLLPGIFTFVNHVEAKADYDVILVKYTPDLTMMRLFEGVNDLYQKRIESLGFVGGSKKAQGKKTAASVGKGKKKEKGKRK